MSSTLVPRTALEAMQKGRDEALMQCITLKAELRVAKEMVELLNAKLFMVPPTVAPAHERSHTWLCNACGHSLAGLHVPCGRCERKRKAANPCTEEQQVGAGDAYFNLAQMVREEVKRQTDAWNSPANRNQTAEASRKLSPAEIWDEACRQPWNL